MPEKCLKESERNAQDTEDKGESSYRLVKNHVSRWKGSDGGLDSIFRVTENGEKACEQPDDIFLHVVKSSDWTHLYKAIWPTFAFLFLRWADL